MLLVPLGLCTVFHSSDMAILPIPLLAVLILLIPLATIPAVASIIALNLDIGRRWRMELPRRRVMNSLVGLGILLWILVLVAAWFARQPPLSFVVSVLPIWTVQLLERRLVPPQSVRLNTG
ncbi:hypothetical protein GCM10011594_40190 [Nakamurella endophytica]|uniref:Uncharacterized protein n=2 Tax=Nakamurella endophytica TaxID=1748367 RepID=A0A917TA76_9ACTN|nr:hypothetical protein GCM10011594_40190 [Nakamurella endophytica]